MKITTSTEAKAANEKFNHFHDGFLRRLELVRDMESFEVKAPDGSTIEEDFWNGVTVVLDVNHRNYDYPNQPENRMVRIRGLACIDIVDNLQQFLANDIFDLQFKHQPKGLACLLTYHPTGAPVRSTENGKQITLFLAETIEVTELLYQREQRG